MVSNSSHLSTISRVKRSSRPVEDFALATAVERRFTGRLVELSTRVDESEDVGAEVQGVVSLPENETSLQQRHIGAEVAAKIHCGKKSLGYVLFGDVVEFLAKRFWL